MRFLQTNILLLLFVLPVFFSCKVTKPPYYFQDIKKDTVITNTAVNTEELKIKNTDILNINITSLSKEEDALFMGQLTQAGGSASTGTTTNGGFPVDKDGDIHLHKLGKVRATGKTRIELKNELEKLLLPYLKDPIVTVSFANHFVTIIGDVGTAQQLSLPEEKISLLDLIARSGNTNATAQLNNLLVIREKDLNSKEFKHINLQDHSIFTSSWYYLQPNDVVVVNLDAQRQIETERRLRNQQVSTLVLQALSVIVIITNIFKN